MRRASSFFKKVAENFDFCKKLVFFRIFLLAGVLFIHGDFYAQEIDSIQRSSQAVIVVANGAKIYSADPSFNRQVVNHKITLKNAHLSIRKNPDKVNSLQITSGNRENRSGAFGNDPKIAKIKKAEDLRKVSLHILGNNNKWITTSKRSGYFIACPEFIPYICSSFGANNCLYTSKIL